jgi:hypothetical protein
VRADGEATDASADEEPSAHESTSGGAGSDTAGLADEARPEAAAAPSEPDPSSDEPETKRERHWFW